MVERVRVEQEKAEQESTRERQRRFPARRRRRLAARQSHIGVMKVASFSSSSNFWTFFPIPIFFSLLFFDI